VDDRASSSGHGIRLSCACILSPKVVQIRPGVKLGKTRLFDRRYRHPFLLSWGRFAAELAFLRC
jgi:hypothetical protein